jgi:hypothetical protein
MTKRWRFWKRRLEAKWVVALNHLQTCDGAQQRQPPIATPNCNDDSGVAFQRRFQSQISLQPNEYLPWSL